MRWSGVVLALVVVASGSTPAQEQSAEIDARIQAVMPKVIAWRRDIHQHPELSNREVRTAGLVAAHLRALGLDVRTGVAKTGVVGILRGGRPGKVVALRADMDALPVAEVGDLPFKSVETATYNGQTVGVMHACGHDAHVAMLMGVAEVLTSMKDRLPGTVKFIFQPAEEGPPAGETGGAGDMVAEGVLDEPPVDAIFGLHVMPLEQGTLWSRAGGLMASSDRVRIVVHGKQTHGAAPWGGVDPITVSAQIVTALQTIVSRQIDLTEAPAVVTIGRITGGVRFNIIPDTVEMEGTIRALDPNVQRDIHARVKRTAELVAESAGARAEVELEINTAPVLYNDAALTDLMTPTLRRVSGNRFFTAKPRTLAEDFAKFQQKVPGLFFYLGVNRPGAAAASVAENHSPLFFVDEGALPTGVRAMASLALDYLGMHAR
ncbi:MAG: amidohydrolase [Acidobacteria bacterium]|nr:amidohydrolase [Acidobacteriota bacterium]